MDLAKIFTEHVDDDGNIGKGNLGKLETAIKKAIGVEFVAKDRYDTKLSQIADLEGQLADAKDSGTQLDSTKQELEKAKQELVDFKAQVDAEKTTAQKTNALKAALAEAGANEKAVPLLIKEFDLTKIELDGDKVKDAESIIKPVKEGYADFFGETRTHGASVPPAGGNGKPNYDEMDDETYYATKLKQKE